MFPCAIYQHSIGTYFNQQNLHSYKILHSKQSSTLFLTMSDLKINPNLPPCKYEYLDHTADVQLHAWGDSLKEAFEQCGMAMFGYMTDLSTVDIYDVKEITAIGHDLESLLFQFLDELLFVFSCDPYFICCKVVIVEFKAEEEFKIICKCYGEEFDLKKHPQGTEVKAITYSAMQIVNNAEKDEFEVFVIIDI